MHRIFKKQIAMDRDADMLLGGGASVAVGVVDMSTLLELGSSQVQVVGDGAAAQVDDLEVREGVEDARVLDAVTGGDVEGPELRETVRSSRGVRSETYLLLQSVSDRSLRMGNRNSRLVTSDCGPQRPRWTTLAAQDNRFHSSGAQTL